MSWAKLDDGFWSHPKVLAAGLAAVGLHVKALAWSSQYLTEGRIPKASVFLLLAGESAALCDRLVACGLWDEDGDAWLLHDYLDYNPTREKALAERERARERMREKRAKEAERSANVRANNTGTSGERAAHVFDPVPVPVPDPVVPSERRETRVPREPPPSGPSGSEEGKPAEPVVAKSATTRAEPSSGCPPIDTADETGDRGAYGEHMTATEADADKGAAVLNHIAAAWGQQNTWQAAKRRLQPILRAKSLDEIRAVIDWHARPSVRRKHGTQPTIPWVFKDLETFESWQNQARGGEPVKPGHPSRDTFDGPVVPRTTRAGIEAELATFDARLEAEVTTAVAGGASERYARAGLAAARRAIVERLGQQQEAA